MIFFIFSLLYVIIYIIRYKVLNKKGIFNGLITFIYPFFVYIIKSVELNGYIFFFDLGIGLFFIIAFILSIISIILYCILVKEKSDRKNYIGGMIAAFCSTLLLTLIIPYMTIQTINYTFDNSKGSIGTTLSCTYKDVARFNASTSIGVFSLT